MCASNSLKKMS